MSYGLNVEMHKQTEICKRLDAIIRQVLPFLSGEVRTFFYTRCLDLVLDGNNTGNTNLRQLQTFSNHMLFWVLKRTNSHFDFLYDFTRFESKNTIKEFNHRKFVFGVFLNAL